MTLYEDNQATSRIIQTGKYPKLRHVQRLHGVNISWLHDLNKRGLYDIVDTHTKRQAGDIFTKHFTSVPCWEHAMKLIGILCDDKLASILRGHIVHHPVQELRNHSSAGAQTRYASKAKRAKQVVACAVPIMASSASSGIFQQAAAASASSAPFPGEALQSVAPGKGEKGGKKGSEVVLSKSAAMWQPWVISTTTMVASLFNPSDVYGAAARGGPEEMLIQMEKSGIPGCWTSADLPVLRGELDIAPPPGPPKWYTYGIFGDSGALMYPAGRSGKAKPWNGHLWNSGPSFANTNLVGKAVGGADCKGIIAQMTNCKEFMSGTCDVVSITCFLNGALSKGGKYLGEPDELQGDFEQMCTLLK